MPLIDKSSPTPYYQQIYEQIAHSIETGVYAEGRKLPSIRECARELGVSNTTIELAYQRLTEEGYVRARRGSGYTICRVVETPASPADRFDDEYRKALGELSKSIENRKTADGLPDETPSDVAFDFAYDAVDPALFPFTTWARISREVFFSKGAVHACLYNDPQGLHELREQIARYVGGEYGVPCTAEQVLVLPTTRDLMAAITSLFDSADTVFAMENPGYDEVGRKLEDQGFSTVSIPTFPFPAWDDLQGVIDGARIVFTTPACQFPTNVSMPMDLRKRLVDWANETDAYLIDDEYGWEFQSGVARVPPLATLDTAGRVITIGTFSNSFTPAVCLSYAILPPQLMLKWRTARKGSHPQVPWQTQAAMAAFMGDDHWRAHIRKIRTIMQRKRQTLAKAIEAHMGSAVETIVGPSSLFVLVKAKDGRAEQDLVDAAAAAGVRVYPTSQYWRGQPPADWRYVLVGYAGIAQAAIDPGIQALAEAWQISR